MSSPSASPPSAEVVATPKATEAAKASSGTKKATQAAPKKATKAAPKKATTKKATPTHPSWKDLIIECITASDAPTRQGVSRIAIKKFAEDNYKLSTPAHLSQLKRAITSCVESGVFVLPKGPSGCIKLAPKARADATKENSKPASASKPKTASKPATKPKPAKKPASKPKSVAVTAKKAVVGKKAAPSKAKAPAKKAAALKPRSTKKVAA
ncbi:hypothetical protein DFH09DRAFT_1281896 [Mycena vulgaris]|nr:hypothetical protein DFH09DRAFT_1281896 [Mycena vulgaris]